MTPPVCGWAVQKTKTKSQDPSTENLVYPEVYLESRQSKMEKFAKTNPG